jgi:hypothetical protein
MGISVSTLIRHDKEMAYFIIYRVLLISRTETFIVFEIATFSPEYLDPPTLHDTLH